MKKLLGISLVAVLAATPLMANADITGVTLKGNGTVAANTNIATTSYVQGAYNDLAGHINTNVSAINTLNGSGEGSVTQKIADNAANATFVANGSYDEQSIGYAIQHTSAAAIEELDAEESQDAGSGNGQLNLSITQENGVITAISGSIEDGTYASAAQGTKADSAVQTVKVNNQALTATDNEVNVTVAEGTDNGTIAVNSQNVSVHGLGTAAYQPTTAFDASGAAAAAQTAAEAHADQRIVPVYGTWGSDSQPSGNATLINTPAGA